MRRTFLVCLIFSAVVFSSCNYVPAKKKMLIYNQISGTNDTVDKMTREWYRQLNMSVKDRNFSRLSQYRISMGQFLSSHRSVIANLRFDVAAQNLLDSEEAFLANRATVVSDVYSSFESFNEMTPPDVVNAQLRLITYDMGNEINSNAAINKSLKVYADRDKLNTKKK